MTTIVFEKQIAASASELPRLLRQGLGRDDYRFQGSRLTMHSGEGKTLRIDISDGGVRRIGLIALPLLDLVFRFSGYGQDEAQSAMAYFDLHTQRGGG